MDERLNDNIAFALESLGKVDLNEAFNDFSLIKVRRYKLI